MQIREKYVNCAQNVNKLSCDYHSDSCSLWIWSQCLFGVDETDGSNYLGGGLWWRRGLLQCSRFPMVPVGAHSGKRGISWLLSWAHRSDLQSFEVDPDNGGLSFDHGGCLVYGTAGLRYQIVLPLVFYDSFDWPL